MTKIQVHLREEELEALHRVAKETGESLAEIIRKAIRQVWLKPNGNAPVNLRAAPARRTSVEHDSIYDEV